MSGSEANAGLIDATPKAEPSAEDADVGTDLLERHETSGLTSRLLLAHIERAGGLEAVQAVLERSGLADREADFRRESHWFSYETKIRLFEAAADVMDDPHAVRNAGETALDLGIAEGLKIALRALGSPRLVYQNVVRANSKFSASHVMELLELGRTHARIRYVSRIGPVFSPLDCDYNVGLLSCVPGLFGQPPARVAHPQCAGRGDPACVYDITWTAGTAPLRLALGCAVAGALPLAASAILAPALMPAAVAVAAVAGACGIWRTVTVRRAQWRHLHEEVREHSAVAQRLQGSFQELVGDLRLDDVLDNVCRHAQSAIGGKEFALIVKEGSGPSCRSSSGLPKTVIAALESWAAARLAPSAGAVLIQDLETEPHLGELPSHPQVPLGSLCAAALTFRGSHLGVLVALGSQAEAFLPRDVELLETYAAQAAIAVNNARLYAAQEELALRDPLTGLRNHRAFHETLADELERCRRYGADLSVAVLDLDGFKKVNDASGHADGDRVLREVSVALAASCRTSDRAFRVGGDEFALVLPNTAQGDAQVVAERAQRAIAAVDPRIGASFGIAAWPDDGGSRDVLVAHADAALYAMKDGAFAPSPFAQPPSGRPARGEYHMLLASRLSARLAPSTDPAEIARLAVSELDRGLGYPLSLIMRLDADQVLRTEAVAGELRSEVVDVAWSQSIEVGINGRVARTGEPALISDTAEEPQYAGHHFRGDDGPRLRAHLSVPIRAGEGIWGVLVLCAEEPYALGQSDQVLLETVAAQVGAALHRSALYAELERAFTTTLGTLSDVLEAKDGATAEHSRAVADLAEAVAVRLGVVGEELRKVRNAALLHDIGKVSVRTELLAKPGPLTEAEYLEVQEHAGVGANILERTGFLSPIAPLVRASHERWDGRGYPDRLSGEEIPLGARIVCACDAAHAMLADRPYRPALEPAEVRAELVSCSGSQFDPSVIEALLAELSAPSAR
jgi:diguanylate cyclase (GGDEF)-like protein/putative nucleotidyltransferase with HDIG domain